MANMGNAFVHCELSADDVAAARKFYSKLFDWKIGPSDPKMGDYAMIDVGSKTSGGGLTKKMMPGQPTGWLTYVEVDSVKKTMAKAVKAGAKPMVQFQEIGEMGAIGIFIDPQGAALGVWERGKPVKKAARKPVAKPAKKPAKRK
jgi:predicted enzyme related to lactoylglutathione lyase